MGYGQSLKWHTIQQIAGVLNEPATQPTGYIANEAEYTPRNVQTVASRSTTVYRVEISLPNSDLSLKPGMPADATFSIGQ